MPVLPHAVDRVAALLRRRDPAPTRRARPLESYAEVRVAGRSVTYAVAENTGVPLRLIDFRPPSAAPYEEIALYYGPLPDPDDPQIEGALAANLEDLGISVLATRIVWLAS